MFNLQESQSRSPEEQLEYLKKIEVSIDSSRQNILAKDFPDEFVVKKGTDSVSFALGDLFEVHEGKIRFRYPFSNIISVASAIQESYATEVMTISSVYQGVARAKPKIEDGTLNQELVNRAKNNYEFMMARVEKIANLTAQYDIVYQTLISFLFNAQNQLILEVFFEDIKEANRSIQDGTELSINIQDIQNKIRDFQSRFLFPHLDEFFEKILGLDPNNIENRKQINSWVEAIVKGLTESKGLIGNIVNSWKKAIEIQKRLIEDIKKLREEVMSNQVLRDNLT